MNPHEKLLEKANKVLGMEQTNEVRALGEEQLRNIIVASTREISEAKAELESNPKYQEVVENKKALSSGYSDLKKLLNVKIQLAINTLQERGK